jgi:hypothetical protein
MPSCSALGWYGFPIIIVERHDFRRALDCSRFNRWSVTVNFGINRVNTLVACWGLTCANDAISSVPTASDRHTRVRFIGLML